MKTTQRSQRIGELMQRELSVLIRDEIKDPRVGMVTVMAVRVSSDLAHARIYVTTMDEDEKDATIGVLNRAAGFLARNLATRIDLRIMPALKFVYDESIAHGDYMDRLIHQAVKSDRKEPFEDEP